jgi:glucokinase
LNLICCNLAIDIGGTNTRYAFILNDGRIIFQSVIETGHSSDPEELLGRLSSNIIYNFEPFKKEFYLQGIGIGAPNVNIYDRTIENPVNLNWKGKIPFAKMMEKKFSLPVILTNDANAGALGEMYFGGAKNLKDFVFITLGTGLGSGIVSNGKLVVGKYGYAGEIGHVTIIEDGRICGCGRRGCLEQYCSATGLVKTYLELSGKISPGEIDAEDVFIKAKNNDAIATKAFDITGDILGRSLTNTVAHLDPEVIFLFGGLVAAGDFLLNPLKKSFQENLFPAFKNKTKIMVSEVPGNDAALLGATSSIIDYLHNS